MLALRSEKFQIIQDSQHYVPVEFREVLKNIPSSILVCYKNGRFVYRTLHIQQLDIIIILFHNKLKEELDLAKLIGFENPRAKMVAYINKTDCVSLEEIILGGFRAVVLKNCSYSKFLNILVNVEKNKYIFPDTLMMSKYY